MLLSGPRKAFTRFTILTRSCLAGSQLTFLCWKEWGREWKEEDHKKREIRQKTRGWNENSVQWGGPGPPPETSQPLWRPANGNVSIGSALARREKRNSPDTWAEAHIIFTSADSLLKAATLKKKKLGGLICLPLRFCSRAKGAADASESFCKLSGNYNSRLSFSGWIAHIPGAV